ncbi:MAG: hypothetical protein IH614_06850, partial [Desulfuromonadales bacterium]|nr:hypothetical protein [Desulfuromonadales bacterium]
MNLRKGILGPVAFATCLLLALVSASAPAMAAKEKYFDRSGRLIVEEKPAADFLRSYEPQSKEPAKTFP